MRHLIPLLNSNLVFKFYIFKVYVFKMSAGLMRIGSTGLYIDYHLILCVFFSVVNVYDVKSERIEKYKFVSLRSFSRDSGKILPKL